MPRRPFLILCSLLWLGVPKAFGQFGEVPISTFGYFQVSFQHQDDSIEEDTENSFTVQQLNLIFETNLSQRWRAFVDFELVNNFSSSRRWGSFDLNEAWINYRANRWLSVKAGLQVPIFNHLNDIKNRTPLLPYVIRPLVYEESFREIVNIEEFVPERAFTQVKGFIPVNQAKLDYAVYIGNSPNVRSQFDNLLDGGDGQTGVDTTTTVLVGGRFGVRYGELTLGGSITRETVNFFTDLEELLALSAQSLNGVPKTRLGADLSFHLGRLSVEGELIAVRYDVDPPADLKPASGQARPRLDLDRLFYYGTVGYHLKERLFAYASYWYSDELFNLQAAPVTLRDGADIKVPTVGFRYTVLRDDVGFDRVTLKAQYAYARIRAKTEGSSTTAFVAERDVTSRLHFFAVGVSVLF